MILIAFRYISLRAHLSSRPSTEIAAACYIREITASTSSNLASKLFVPFSFDATRKLRLSFPSIAVYSHFWPSFAIQLSNRRTFSPKFSFGSAQSVEGQGKLSPRRTVVIRFADASNSGGGSTPGITLHDPLVQERRGIGTYEVACSRHNFTLRTVLWQLPVIINRKLGHFHPLCRYANVREPRPNGDEMILSSGRTAFSTPLTPSFKGPSSRTFRPKKSSARCDTRVVYAIININVPPRHAFRLSQPT